ncbi:hypothetical protein [Desulfoluna spongiiphila]|uniref:Uncharacterized protein n=1 Tax=Desulfoluna spongiiphila TaxID=419481 RepID=A0A1G5ADG7_9BACT|nr:hypothetical protein [Desulfoluna spongiiphila]SCX75930.1 hypothetical protein SAMN05216233_10177 [Desulfoluna spongiiphila]
MTTSTTLSTGSTTIDIVGSMILIERDGHEAWVPLASLPGTSRAVLELVFRTVDNLPMPKNSPEVAA